MAPKRRSKRQKTVDDSRNSKITVDIPSIEYVNLFIDNEFVPSASGETFECVNPSTEEILCEIASGNQDDIDRAVAAAQKAFEIGSEWRTMDASLRGEYLNRIADLMERDREILASLECLDNGKPYGDAFNVDCALSIRCFRYYAGWCDKLHGKTIPIDGPFLCFTRKEPVGVVGQITPWNFPLLMASWKLAPALCCGNVVVLKPAEQTPLTALHLAALIREAGLPKGVVNVVPGFGHSAGDALSRHMDVDKIAFTGSTLVGRKILKAAGESNCKNVTLELGGKSPCVVFDDADVDEAVEIAHHAIFFNMGQCCAAGSRTYVQDAIYDEFVRKAVARAKTRITGDPFVRGVEHGPQVNSAQKEKILGYLKKGVKEGGKILAGGNSIDRDGYFVEPTVLEVSHDNICAREEIFGPVQTIIRFRTVDQVVKLANDSDYGLAAGVVTQNLEIAMRMAQELRAGSVWTNSYDVFSAQAPFGGYKESGLGRELGEEGLHQYSHTKTVVIKVSAKNS